MSKPNIDLRYIDIPKINDGALFEELCRDLLIKNTKYENVNLNGRRGQSQNGVDVFARIIEDSKWIGVQCKVRNNNNNAFSLEELRAEINDAKKFNPSLSEYYIYTTLSRDAPIQSFVRILQDELLKEEHFTFEIIFWEDIVDILKQEIDLYFKYYRHYFYDTTSIGHSIGKLMNLDLGTGNDAIDTHYEIIIGKIPNTKDKKVNANYYRGMYYIVNLHNKKIEFFRIPCYESDIEEAFSNQIDCFRVNKWLNSITDLENFLYDDNYTNKFFISEDDFEKFQMRFK